MNLIEIKNQYKVSRVTAVVLLLNRELSLEVINGASGATFNSKIILNRTLIWKLGHKTGLFLIIFDAVITSIFESPKLIQTWNIAYILTRSDIMSGAVNILFDSQNRGVTAHTCQEELSFLCICQILCWLHLTTMT